MSKSSGRDDAKASVGRILTRRDFLQATAAGVGGLWVATRSGRAWAAIPAGTLDPRSIAQFVTALVVPPAMPRAGKIRTRAGRNVDSYEIAVRQLQQQILPPGLPATTVWAYGPAVAQNGPTLFHAPSMTIEARANTPVRIRWINELVDANGDYLPHLLPVDPTLHWANPGGGLAARDSRPTYESVPGPYTGPVPMVPHVHGMVDVGDESDGYAEAWWLPAARNLPAGHAREGTWHAFFRSKAETRHGVNWSPGSATFQYPVAQRASTAWYHDHTLGMTRLNVYAGPAGFFVVRGGPADAVLDGRTGGSAVLPGPAPALGDAPGTRYYEIPLAIQDRAFNADGSLFYPDTREFFDELEGPFIPFTDVSPIWNPEFFGNCIVVNGRTWPNLDVEQRRYRFRILNGCNARFLILNFAAITGVQVTMIGNEGGFLASPVDLTGTNAGQLLIAPAERADLIVDFTSVAPGRYVLENLGPDEPFGGGLPGVDFDPADPTTTGRILQFTVGAVQSADASTPPRFLQLPVVTPIAPAGAVRRPLLLAEAMSGDFDDAPKEARLGTVDFDVSTGAGASTPRMWVNPVTENPQVGATEIWEFYNTTADAHPMHIHGVLFQIVDRQRIEIREDGDEAMGGPSVTLVPGTSRGRESWENGFKDTVIAYPGEVTRVIATFGTAGQFVWHCHIVEHEDNEMMRPFRVGAPQPGQP
jgi:FtsP/CotA-like multicopper oxidase with cupredoxin domain